MNPSPLHILLSLSLLIANVNICFAGNEPFVEKDSIVIKGSIVGHKPGDDGSFISFFTYDLRGRRTKRLFEISSDGHFTATLFQPFEGDVYVSFRQMSTLLYTIPGDTMSLTIGEEVSVKGRTAAINSELFDFMAQYQQHQFLHQTDMSNTDQTDSAFAASKIERLVEELDLLKRFRQGYRADQQAFGNWAKNYLVFNAACGIVSFPFLGKVNKELNFSGLFALLKDIPLNERSALHNSRYYNFLSLVSTSLEIIRNLYPGYATIKKSGSYDPLVFILDSLDGRFTGVSKDIMYMDCYLNNTDRTSAGIRERVYSRITNDYIRQRCMEKEEAPKKGFVRYDIAERLRSLPTSNTSKEKILHILENEKGAALFIDFWGSWCAPCMAELPYYPQVITAFKGLPLKFIFFSVETTDRKMLEIRQKYGIEGTFINLSRDEADIMNKIFDFSSYPHHFLVNAKGMVIDDGVAGLITGGKVDNTVVENIKKSIAD